LFDVSPRRFRAIAKDPAARGDERVLRAAGPSRSTSWTLVAALDPGDIVVLWAKRADESPRVTGLRKLVKQGFEDRLLCGFVRTGLLVRADCTGS
jgi:hypothetical protein